MRKLVLSALLLFDSPVAFAQFIQRTKTPLLNKIITLLKLRFCILFMLCVGINTQAQSLHHQMLSAQGTSVQLSSGKFVGQTIGQQSVIGNSTKNGVTYGQGFQQSKWHNYIIANASATSISTVTYPNPFIETVNFQFSKPIADAIAITVFDIRGRLVFQQEKRADGSLLTIDLPQLADSNYLVRLAAPNYTYYTQILKQK
jgi:hypothetical protein